MLFNSFDFGFFLCLVYSLYWLIGVKRRRSQNILLLVSSYVFYGLWDWRFLFLLIGSSLVDYLAGRSLARTERPFNRKLILWASLLWNLGVLAIFKYFNFFLESFTGLFGMELDGTYTFWNIAIPLGLSFYTFQTISYTVDVYKRRIPPTKNLLDFLCFVSFFPQLVAGPIERAKDLIPQFTQARKFDYRQSIWGLRQILWGLFKKVIVAEKLGLAVSMVFANPEGYHFATIIYALVLFCFQIYCDFSGYTDIAIGTARLFGFNLSRNFNLPYLAKSLTEFWQRWHITLTRWFTDYVYVPLVQSVPSATKGRKAWGLFLTMVLIGLWHGANWTFIVFGLFNGLVLIVERIPFSGKNNYLLRSLNGAPRLVGLFYVFVLFTISALLFRSADLNQVWDMGIRILQLKTDGVFNSLIGIKIWYLLAMLAAEVLSRNWEFPLQYIERKFPRPLRWALYYLLIFVLIRYAEPKEAFIYFQF